MRTTLQRWIADADTQQSIDAFGLALNLESLNYQTGRSRDLYYSLVGQLFELIRYPPDDARDWATIGNALAQHGETLVGPIRSDAMFFAAAAFYSGGYSASAYLTMSRARPEDWANDTYKVAHDLLARPRLLSSRRAAELLAALRDGRMTTIREAVLEARRAAADALDLGPEEWVASEVYSALLDRFGATNLRAVLPDGGSNLWNPLVGSLMDRQPPVWDFFPSQVAAIRAGLLASPETFSLQMPTGAGKTALTETLMFSHLVSRPGDVAVLLVPYRALARELRRSLGRRLTDVGLPTKTVYGGTVPTREETRDLDEIRALIATPEALTGVLSRSPDLLDRLSLVVCDEGHLLDEGSRGIGLELLLARLRERRGGEPRYVFVSAIVPNIEEINAWLGGSDDTVVRSDFRPAEAEYAVLRPRGRGRAMTVNLEMQAPSTSLQPHTLPAFLSVSDFEFVNRSTRNRNTYGYASVKTQAIAAALKALGLGTVAVFAATKTGDQGVVGLAEELLDQLRVDLPLPRPSEHIVELDEVNLVVDYLRREYGSEWIGTRALQAGAVVHHGDVPQETREAVEELLTQRRVRMVICTRTLAEGVNLPIRTLVLYAVQRRTRTGRAEPMLAREIRNLVGRAGRAGNSTKGLVICANPNQWPEVRAVAAGRPGETVTGALHRLIQRLHRSLRDNGHTLTSDDLEETPELFALVDGIDTTLLELLHEEIGPQEFREVAARLASGTFAARRADRSEQDLLSSVFELRAERMLALRDSGRLAWVRETGARVRLVDRVVDDLAASFDAWEDVTSPLDEGLLDALLGWALRQPDFRREARDAYRADEPPPAEELRRLVRAWIQGESFVAIARLMNYDLDDLLRIHSQVIAHSLATLVEQAVAVLARVLAENGSDLAASVAELPELLRYGVATPHARSLMAAGVRHRAAAVALGSDPAMSTRENLLREPIEIARDLLGDPAWRARLGEFVLRRTLRDVGSGDSST